MFCLQIENIGDNKKICYNKVDIGLVGHMKSKEDIVEAYKEMASNPKEALKVVIEY